MKKYILRQVSLFYIYVLSCFGGRWKLMAVVDFLGRVGYLIGDIINVVEAQRGTSKKVLS